MARLLPIMASVFAGFLLIGLALRVLPLHLHKGLGFGPFAVGLVTGSQFVASLLSRIGAGKLCRCARRQAGRRHRPGRRRLGGVHLSRIARIARPADGVRVHAVRRPGRVGGGGKLHHHGRRGLGSGSCRRAALRQGHRLGRHRCNWLSLPSPRRRFRPWPSRSCLPAGDPRQEGFNGKCATRDGSWDSAGPLTGPPQCGGTSAHSSLAKPRLSRTHELPVTTALPLAHL